MQHPNRIEEAKKMATGPLGEEMSKFPLLFAKAACFGQRPSKTRPAKINNGTISLVNFGKGVLGITCHHVIECYRHRREREGDIVFQIGNVELDPLVQLVDENTRIDVATIHLTEPQVRAITSDGEIGSCVFQPRSWPPPLLKAGDYVAFGGFPGNLRILESFDELVFPSLE
jgi:hypothetical protein